MNRDGVGALLLHVLCCGLPLLIVLGGSLAPMALAFLETQWFWLALGVTILTISGLIWRWRRQAMCADNACTVPAPSARQTPALAKKSKTA